MSNTWSARLLQALLLIFLALEGALGWTYLVTDASGIARERARCEALAAEGAGKLQALLPEASQHPQGASAHPSVVGLHHALSDMHPGAGGYAFVVTRDGRYVSHPIAALAEEKQTLVDRARDTDNEGLKALAEAIRANPKGVLEYVSPLSRQASWLTYQAVPESDLVVALSVVKGELVPTAPQKRRLLILMALCLGPLLGLLALRRPELDEPTLWRASSGLALGFATTIAVVWSHGPLLETLEEEPKRVLHALANASGSHEANHHAPEGHEVAGHEGTPHETLHPILDHDALARYQAKLSQRAQAEGQPQPRFVRTGLYVRTVEFNSEQDVRLGGTIWQRFKLGEDDAVPRGVRFPESISRNSASLVEVMRKRINGYEVVGWDFDQVIRSPKRFEAYPLNDILLALHIWPQELTGQVMLVPDLDAYPLMDPQVRPGVDTHLVTTRPLEESFFGLKSLAFGTNFGDPKFAGELRYPELAYIMNFRNDMYVPVFANLFPILMIAILLFATLMNQSKTPGNWGVFGMVSGLFFSLAVAQVKLREMFETETLVYLEQFYVVLYVALALVCLNTLLLSRPPEQRPAWVAYRENLLPRVLFWPVLTGTLACLTLRIFY
ncbi:MAG: hypothetical protein VKP62_15665 [Candidatus Sericytochromatia bacterium]|nr:hypothetical protein [Candidatus Sericytochromatia bacterium]